MHDSTLQPILAVLGYPVAGNPMQFVAERLFAEANLDWQIVSLNVAPERLPDALAGADAMGLTGLAIADPHRQAAAAWFGQKGVIDFAMRQPDGRLEGRNLIGEQFAYLVSEHASEEEGLALYGADADAVALANGLSERTQPIYLVDFTDDAIDGAGEQTHWGPPPESCRGILTSDADPPNDVEILADLRGQDLPSDTPITRLDLTVGYIDEALHRWTERRFGTDLIRDLVEEYWAI